FQYLNEENRRCGQRFNYLSDEEEDVSKRFKGFGYPSPTKESKVQQLCLDESLQNTKHEEFGYSSPTMESDVQHLSSEENLQNIEHEAETAKEVLIFCHM
ncbi:hypothetical protein H5410_046228, partial [Solanum commersonii]